MITQMPRGTKDWFGEEMAVRTAIEKTARDLCVHFNIQEISTPVFEHTDLFQRSVGDTTDIVQKEMYTFMDKGNRSITLKPEGTAGVVRSYLEQKMYAKPQPTKLFYMTPAFRYEKPQAGRLRQHHQFGVEFFGSASPLAEVEIVTLLMELFERLGIKGASLHINNIGCDSCRADYNKALVAFLEENKSGLCETCRERMGRNPLRVLDCKVPSCQSIVKEAPRTIDYLDEPCKDHFDQLQDLLGQLDIPFEIDTNIVRGLDYYTKTVFEFIDEQGMTICGGGRYDNLVKEVDGKMEVPAVGFGIGIERIMLALKNEGIVLAKVPPVALYVGVLGEAAQARAYGIVRGLRKAGVIVETDYLGKSVKAQMKYADKIGALHTVIIGENELEEGKAVIKEMASGQQIEVALSEIKDYFIKQTMLQEEIQ